MVVYLSLAGHLTVIMLDENSVHSSPGLVPGTQMTNNAEFVAVAVPGKPGAAFYPAKSGITRRSPPKF